MTAYEYMGLPTSATAAVIRKAFLKLSVRWHPDKNPNSVQKATRVFKKLNEAYDILRDENIRQQYDRFLQEQQQFQQWQSQQQDEFEQQQQSQQPPYFPRGGYRKTWKHTVRRQANQSMPCSGSSGRQPTSRGQAWRLNFGQKFNVTSSSIRDAASSAGMQRRRRGNTNTNGNWRYTTSGVNNVNMPGQRHDIHEGSYADRMHPSWRETSSVCTEAGNFHGGNHSRGAYRSQFETMNSYAALNKGSYRNAAKKVSGSSKCAPLYPACEKYTTSSSRSPGARGKTFTKKLTRNSRNVTK